MKKYMQPQSQLLSIHTEGIIATSLPVGETPGPGQLSNSFNDWTHPDWHNSLLDE